jgi:iron complex outermembrane receptor protein
VQLGTKNRFLNDRLQVNAEIFHYDYKGYQTLGIILLPSNILSFLTLNSQTAEFYGAEIEATFLLTRRDQLFATAAPLRARFRVFDVPSAGVDASGQQVPNAPTYMASLGYQHEFGLAGGARITAHIETHITGPQWVDLQQRSGSHQDAYTRTDADLAYHSPGGHWRMTAWVRNLENYGALTAYIATFGANGPETWGVPLPPRTFGVRAQYVF